MRRGRHHLVPFSAGMRAMSTHPLTRFVYETSGQQFGDLLLAGYGAGPSSGRSYLRVTESEVGEEVAWVIELVALRPPCRDEPLVLAALLKLLLSRPIISQPLEFGIGELLAELRWPDSPDTRRRVEEALVSYVGLLYDKRPDGRSGRRAQAGSGGGCYHLLAGYTREALAGTGSVYFAGAFIRGLLEGRVYFAGIDFGTLNRIDN